ncbi:hypothetical protein ACET3Z_031487 [Daucus carota]
MALTIPCSFYNITRMDKRNLDSVLPKWIEGLITKEVEASIQDNERFQDPGTFVLQSPTSTSWLHPDADFSKEFFLLTNQLWCQRNKCEVHIKKCYLKSPSFFDYGGKIYSLYIYS